MPTVLHYLGHRDPFIAFGNDLLNDTAQHFVVNYNGFYQIFQDDHLLQFDGERSTALFDFKRDTMLRHDLRTDLPEVLQTLEPRLRAFIQQYNQRLMDNRMLVGEGQEVGQQSPSPF
jgi:hypothetical protein